MGTTLMAIPGKSSATLEPERITDHGGGAKSYGVIVCPGCLALAKQNFAPGIHVTSQTRPSFIVHSEDDLVNVENATRYFLQLKTAKVPAELHIYGEGGHGYGLHRTALPVTGWPSLLKTWLHTIKILPTQP